MTKPNEKPGRRPRKRADAAAVTAQQDEKARLAAYLGEADDAPAADPAPKPPKKKVEIMLRVNPDLAEKLDRLREKKGGLSRSGLITFILADNVDDY